MGALLVFTEGTLGDGGATNYVRNSTDIHWDWTYLIEGVLRSGVVSQAERDRGVEEALVGGRMVMRRRSTWAFASSSSLPPQRTMGARRIHEEGASFL